MRSKSVKTLLGLTLLGLPLLISTPSKAQDSILQPFVAHYTSTWDVGLKIGGTATRQLQQLDNGHWKLSLEAKAMVAKLNETSIFTIEDKQITPLDYQYHRKILNRSKKLHVNLDWSKNIATTTASNSWSMPIEAPLQDKLSVQLQLRKDISLQASGNLTYEVAAGGKVESFTYQVHQQEQLNLPGGDYQAIKVERIRKDDSQRQTYIWFAPQLNFHVIRIVQIEPDGKRYQLDLQSLDQ